MEEGNVNKYEIYVRDEAQVSLALGNGTVYATQNNGDERTSNTNNTNIKFKNNKKQDYINNWNSRLFLHRDKNERHITLADAFIMPDYYMYQYQWNLFFRNDTLDEIIKTFVNYDKTSTMLITGVPGMGKSTITSWLANEYKNNDKFIILRFRDLKRKELEDGLLNAICSKLDCENEDLDDKILVLDGFDEMKALDIREKLLSTFFNDIKDYENLKCIITSRPAYITSKRFQNVVELQKFSIDKIEFFYKKIEGKPLEKKEKIESNLEVLGIPVILYMAIMSKVDISENPTKPELYKRIFADEGGIFDRFYDGESGYGTGNQILRDPNNIKTYLEFLRDVAFKMFEKNELFLTEDEYQIPKLKFDKKSVSILEFPIKHLFESTNFNIEFIHKSIYEYFFSEYIFVSIYKATKLKNPKRELANVLGGMLKKNKISDEILEFLKYRIENDKDIKFDIVKDSFQLMLQNGMTYYINTRLKNVIQCEATVFANMLEVLHLWENASLEFNNSVCLYLRLDNENLNLTEVDLRNLDLRRANLRCADLTKANLEGSNLRGADLSKAKFFNANLAKVDFTGADTTEADLIHAIF